MNKAYIITNPCSGKTTFIASHEKKYKTLHLLDHDSLGVCDDSVLKGLPEYSCVLGGNHKPDKEK